MVSMHSRAFSFEDVVTSFKKFPDELLKSRQGTASSFSPRQDICANCCAHELP
jgi:hypothetical protein